eukprot:3244447-Prymnesium_polylepis.1
MRAQSWVLATLVRVYTWAAAAHVHNNQQSTYTQVKQQIANRAVLPWCSHPLPPPHSTSLALHPSNMRPGENLTTHSKRRQHGGHTERKVPRACDRPFASP